MKFKAGLSTAIASDVVHHTLAHTNTRTHTHMYSYTDNLSVYEYIRMPRCHRVANVYQFSSSVQGQAHCQDLVSSDDIQQAAQA